MKLFYTQLLFGSLAMAAMGAQADHNASMAFDTISVTSTKVERATKEVPESISVIDDATIDDKQIVNISDAINDMPGVFAVSTNGGYDSRMIIRGAGLKAPYGVREIMVVRDGVPMTDPDSFTRFDYIDMQDMERIEVTKGPGSILASNATGGVIQLISKSVFDEDRNRVKIGAGTYGATNLHAKVGGQVAEDDYLSFTASRRTLTSDWREHNEYDSTNLSLKHGHLFDGGGKWMSELSYSKVNMEIPGTMDRTLFEEYKKTGEQSGTDSVWKDSARNSQIYFFNTKYEKSYGDLSFKPRFYINSWDHFHPVTAMINDKKGTVVIGTDLEMNLEHSLFGNDDIFVAGLTARQDKGDNGKKYTYRDVEYNIFSGRISSTLSDAKGDLASVEDSDNKLYGFYLQESMRPTPDTIIDLAVRYDKLSLDIRGMEYIKYDWAAGDYAAGDGAYEVGDDYNLISAKAGASYALSADTNIFALVSQANQAPTDSEISANLDNGADPLDVSTVRNYEVGVKHRTKSFSLDFSVYNIQVSDEIIAVPQGWSTIYVNAGKTDKKGAELAAVYSMDSGLSLGSTYTYSDYTFKTYEEDGVDLSGNRLSYIPEHQYSMFVNYSDASGIKARIQANGWGSYYMDNTNTEKYGGYDMATDIMVGYMTEQHTVQLNVNNVFDLHYAVEAKKDGTKYYYAAAAPRNGMLTYTYHF